MFEEFWSTFKSHITLDFIITGIAYVVLPLAGYGLGRSLTRWYSSRQSDKNKTASPKKKKDKDK